MYAGSDMLVPKSFFWQFREKIVADFSEQQHVSVEHSEKEEAIGKEGTSKVCSDNDRSFASR